MAETGHGDRHLEGRISELRSDLEGRISGLKVAIHESSEDLRAISKTLKNLTKRFDELGITPELIQLIRQVAAESGEAEDTVINKGLELYLLAVEENAQGNRIAVLSPEDEIVREIQGVGRGEVNIPKPSTSSAG